MTHKTTKRQIKVLRYNAIFQAEKDGGYSVWIPSLPGCASQGDNFEQAVANIKEAIELYLEESPGDTKSTDDVHTPQFLVPISIRYA